MYDSDEESEGNPLDKFWLEGDSLAPPCQAEFDVVQEIVKLASPFLNENSVLYDLGCGDGRICIEASKATGCFSIGCEIEHHLCEKFAKNILLYNMEGKVKVVNSDLREMDWNDATVIVIYLLPESVEQIRDKLLDAVRNGAVLICNTWGPKLVTPKLKIQCGFSNNVTLLLFDKSCTDR